jgi:ribonuclease P protein component
MAIRRLHLSRDIRDVFAARNAAHGRLMSVHGHATPQAGDGTRIAVVGGRNVGNAVRRNRAKRRLRAAATSASLPAGCDLVIRAKPDAVDVGFAALRDELERLAGRVARERR